MGVNDIVWDDPKPAQAPQSNIVWNEPTGSPNAAVKTEAPDTTAPMPGPLDALWHGLKQSAVESGQSAEVLKGQRPTEAKTEEQPEATPFEWRDVLEPFGRGLPKLAYQTGASSPTIAGGIAGGWGGSLVEPGLGTAIGGIGGAAAGAAFQTIGPAFARQLKANPSDPNKAWDKAVEETAASGAFSGASWGAYPLRFFKGPLKNLAFQAFGVQPGIGMAEQATKNVIDEKPVTEGLGQAYAQGAVGTAVPAVGHMVLRGEPEAQATPKPTSAEVQSSVNSKLAEAHQLRQDALDPNLSPAEVMRKRSRADDLAEMAAHEVDTHLAPQRAQQHQQQAELLEQQAEAEPDPTKKATLEEQARTQREKFREESFLAMAPPPMPPKGGRIKEWFLQNIAPEQRSEGAARTDIAVAKYVSERARDRDAIQRQGYQWWKKLNKLPFDTDQLRIIDAAETGQHTPQDLVAKHGPWIDQMRSDIRKWLDNNYEYEKKFGSKASYFSDYFPHAWKDEDRAKNIFSTDNMIKTMGPEWFQKSRTYDAIQLGLANGLEPRFNNLMDFVNHRLMSGDDMANKVKLLQDMQELGVATPVEKAAPYLTRPSLVGGTHAWQEVKAPNSEKWLIAPDAADIWKNGVEAKGLWSRTDAIGDGFRGWMKLKNLWVPLKLGLSLFHPVHVMHIAQVNNLSRALGETFGKGQQGLARRFAAVPEAVFQSVMDPFLALPVGTGYRGKDIRNQWLTPREARTKQGEARLKLINEMGLSAQLSEELRHRGKGDFTNAIANNNYIKAIPGAAGAIFRSVGILQHALFDHWIPNLKMAAAEREAAALLRRRPDLIQDDTNRRVALRALGKQIDNRFGEMFYGGLFWNRTLKDAAIGSFLSLGWNLGFMREFGGGTFAPIARRLMDNPNPTQKLVREVTNKTTNMFVYALSAFAINAAINKAFTGENAEGMDYVFPRIGGLNPDGSPRRVTNAFYTREVPMAMKHIQEQQNALFGLSEMFWNKLMFQPISEMIHNRDYFGNKLFDETAPGYKQAYQLGKHLIGDQAYPISVVGARRALQLSGKPYGPTDIPKQITDQDVYMPLLGFGPAPGYVSKSPMENRIQYLFAHHVAASEKPFETGAKWQEKFDARTDYMAAKQRHDDEGMKKAAIKLRELGVKTDQIKKMEPGKGMDSMFQRLDDNDKKSLFKEMNRDEFNHYVRLLGKKAALRGDPLIVALARKFASQSQP